MDQTMGPLGVLGALNVDEVWRLTLASLKEQVPEPAFRTWLEGTQLKEIEEGSVQAASGVASAIAATTRVTAMITVPSNFASEWLHRRYSGPIAEALEPWLGYSVSVEFGVKAPLTCRAGRAISALDGIPYLDPDSPAKGHQMPRPVGQSASRAHSARQAKDARAHAHPFGATPNPNVQGRCDSVLHFGARPPGPEQRAQPGPISISASANSVAKAAPDDTSIPVLNPRNTFDRFLVSRGNQLGVSVARLVAEEPGAGYNPLFIYGFRGVGKTHLLQAIGNYAYTTIQNAHTRMRSRVLYVPATFFDNSIFASRLAAPNAPMNIDLLLVDDLHLIAGASGRAAQRSLVMLVEGMLASGKGVVMTAAQPPDSMLALHDALRFRLRGGTVVELEIPDAELRLKAVAQLVQHSRVPVAAGVVELLASGEKSIGEIYASWERVSARWRPMRGRNNAQEQTNIVRVQDVQAVLAEIGAEAILRAHVRQIRPDTIIDQVASYFDLETNELCEASRERRLTVPRQIAMYLIREQTDRPYEWIARRFGRQDHTTAMHSCARVEELLENSPKIKQMVLELRQMVYGEHLRSDGMRLAG